ncbi:MAG: ribose 5-phosphate isomerase B [Ruminococcus sp.]|nr:ribose 5-phosphate isomerase B [Ruminococcus sp.]
MIAIGCDHAGYDMKTGIIKFLEDKGIEVIDCGCDGSPCDYPVIAKKVCENITHGKADKGILICGTGIGMSIAANKIKGIRASVCSEHFSVKYTRLHNDANVLCMGARVIGEGIAQELTDIFVNTEYEGGRHQKRLDLIKEIEENK